jgi:hypothetical protein
LATTPSSPAPSNSSNQRRVVQPGLPLRERRLQQRLVAQRQQVEGDEVGRRLLGEQVDP